MSDPKPVGLTRLDDAIRELTKIRNEHGNLPIGAFWHDVLGSSGLRFEVVITESQMVDDVDLMAEEIVVVPTVAPSWLSQ